MVGGHHQELLLSGILIMAIALGLGGTGCLQCIARVPQKLALLGDYRLGKAG